MGLFSGVGKVIGSVLGDITGADQTIAAANAAAEQQRLAAQAAAFRPVGVTSSFGTSQFTQTKDPATGLPYISGASYTAAPQLQALQQQLLDSFGEGAQLGSYTASQYMPLTGAAQSLFNLGNQFLPTTTATGMTPEAQALVAQYQQAAQGLAPTDYSMTASPEAMAYANQLRQTASQVMPTSYDTTAEAQRIAQQQQSLLAPEREAQLSNLRNRVFQTGRSGLAVGGTAAGGRGAANPEMQAYYNALAQQDASIAAGAQQQARANLQSDINLAQQLGGTALGTQQQAEQLAQQSLFNRLGTSLGYGQQAYTVGQQDLAARAQALQNQINMGAGLYTQGAGLLGTLTSGQAAAYAPLQNFLSLSQTVEGMAQNPLQLGLQIGTAQQPGQTAYQQGMTQAAQTAYGGVQAANQANAQLLAGIMQAAASASGKK